MAGTVKPVVGSLFAGVGGIDLAFSQAGFQTSWLLEIDKDCQRLLPRHFPGVPIYADIRTVDASRLAIPNVLVGGFPCPDFSVAGLGKGLAGDQGALYFELHRVLRQLCPEWFFFENVPGLLSSNGGADFAIVLGGLTGSIPSIPHGGWRTGGFARGPFYSVAWRVLDAQFFGVPQRRRRVFFVGCSGERSPIEVLFEREGMCWNPSQGREARARSARSVGINAQIGSGHGVDGSIASSLQGGGRRGYRIDAEAAAGGQLVAHQGYTTGSFGGWREGAGTLRNAGGDIGPGSETTMVSDPGCPEIAGSDTSRYGKGPNTTLDDGAVIAVSNRGEYSDELHETLRAKSHGAIPMVAATKRGGHAGGSTHGKPSGTDRATLVPIAFSPNQITSPDNRSNPRPGDPAPTLSTFGEAASVAGGFGVRRLMPVECERLQGFPDGWTEYDAEGKEISDSVRYRMLGNAVAVPCVEWIAQRLYDHLHTD